MVSRMFKLKLNELLYDLKERGFFGRTITFIYVIEFQKYGHSRVHISFALPISLV